MKRSWTRIETPVHHLIPPTRESLKHLLPHSNRPPNYSNQHSSLDSIPICCPISLLSIHAGNVTWNRLHICPIFINPKSPRFPGEKQRSKGAPHLSLGDFSGFQEESVERSRSEGDSSNNLIRGPTIPRLYTIAANPIPETHLIKPSEISSRLRQEEETFLLWANIFMGRLLET